MTSSKYYCIIGAQTRALKNNLGHTRKKDLTNRSRTVIMAQAPPKKIVVVLLLARPRRPPGVKPDDRPPAGACSTWNISGVSTTTPCPRLPNQSPPNRQGRRRRAPHQISRRHLRVDSRERDAVNTLGSLVGDDTLANRKVGFAVGISETGKRSFLVTEVKF